MQFIVTQLICENFMYVWWVGTCGECNFLPTFLQEEEILRMEEVQNVLI